jgi:phage terminase small subunit
LWQRELEVTPRQSAFVREYLIDLNATQAAIRAGYSAKSAEVTASRLLSDAKVAAAVQAGMDKRANKLEISADRVLEEISRMAFYDPATLGISGIHGPADIAKLPEDVRRAIVGWSWDKAGNFTLKLADKLNALDKLGRHLKLFTDKVEHTGKDGASLADEMASAAIRVQERLQRLAG